MNVYFLVPHVASLERIDRGSHSTPPPPLCVSLVTFEDKKRENFERGNLELEKRRHALQDLQRKEQERLATLEREELERKVRPRWLRRTARGRSEEEVETRGAE